MTQSNDSRKRRWNLVAEGFAAFCERWPRYRILAEHGIARLGDLTDSKILDIGCGVGDSTRVLAEHGKDVVAVDFSPKCIEYAKARIQRANVAFEVEDAGVFLKRCSAQFQQFDVIFCNAVIWQLENIEEFLKLAANVTAPGGRLLVNWCDKLTPLPLDFLADRRGSSVDKLELALDNCGWVVSDIFEVELKEQIETSSEFISALGLRRPSTVVARQLSGGEYLVRTWTFVVGTKC
ncbi:class I SAM-dependent methyltransferase [Mesorhizobium delmotii]|uniref:Methyltransferase domain-containing protein n=1 Tax=Mesorhizobium delmotii TaxID=1631247 RepID=A0A2P9AQE3_9HYPH|nr:class I SAM-dependent methyltransferase [Mesorhizobium delmotii]SJM33302.1 hypothetical protein BQ8482_340198 [Mesorhizobium delmotii]